MDLPPPTQIESPPAQITTWTADDAYKYYVLDRIDSSDIPDNVKLFANEHNCFYVMKIYYWSHKIFKNKGGVYVCSDNGNAKFIYDNGKKLRFTKWYESYKIKHKSIYEN
jgi:hypothetical protein